MDPEMADHTVVPSAWTDRDEEIVIQYLLYKKLGLEDVDEIDCKP